MMSPLIAGIIVLVVSVLLISGLIWFVKRANASLYRSRIAVTRSDAKATATREAYERTAKLASQAMDQTGRALYVAQTIGQVSDQVNTVAGQVNVLVGWAAELMADTPPPQGRHGKVTELDDHREKRTA